MSKGKGPKQTPVLPDDCVFEVFRYLAAGDLARASRTCRTWEKLANKNSLWMQLCLSQWRTWPTPSPLSSYYDPSTPSTSEHPDQLDALIGNMSLRSSKTRPPFPPESLPDLHSPMAWYSASEPPYEIESWKHVFRERHEKDCIVRMLLKEVVEDSRNRMRHMDGIAGIGMVHARDVLENIIAGTHGEEKNLTRTFYARKTLKRLQRGWVVDQWRGYRQNEQLFPIWQGCGLISMFSNHELELSQLDRQFQDLANEFLLVSPMPEEHDIVPTVIDSKAGHGLALSGHEDGSKEESKVTDGLHAQNDRVYSTLSERFTRHYESQEQRLKDLVRFFTHEKRFKGNTENYYDPFNSFIDKVLTRKVGIPISLCIVFAELASRVGVVGVDLMGFPQHFMLRFKPVAPRLESRPDLSPSQVTSLAPPVFYLDLFHPPHQLLRDDEYEDYFKTLGIEVPPSLYKALPTPPLEVFLRCLRNIILAVEQTGGAGRIGSDHQTSLYSGITQLIVLHPSEEWGLYVLWLKYLSNFWPEDAGFIRTAMEDIELNDHRRSVARAYSPTSPSSPTGHQRPHHVYGHGRSGLHAMGHFSSPNQETVKILRTQLRELEMMDDAGEVGSIRRRRRPRVVEPRRSKILSEPDTQAGQSSLGATQPDTEVTASSPRIDSHPMTVPHQQRRRDSISGEQQHSINSVLDVSADTAQTSESSKRLGSSSATEGQNRPPEPQFYVGEVFRHKLYRYTGAIYGYDLKCEAEEGWIRYMSVDSSLAYGRHQPFYTALLSDGSRRYVAEENIQVLFREYRHGTGTVPEDGQEKSSLSVATSSSATLPTLPTVAQTIEVDTNAGVEGGPMGLGEADVVEGMEEETTLTSAPALTSVEAAPVRTPPVSPLSLQFSELGPLGIEAVGQYFESWEGQHGHYVMNRELIRVYPTEDYL
ncbi:F-box protein 21 [Entomortierella parvispora]|uniref:F-box protein 21 n=1 Tax=Entomortierella parvispora TaxID=205924 RepID=A0A9P3H1Y1_9FUNG|nr:F-box protein 21 [Entomortierella parvispora]